MFTFKKIISLILMPLPFGLLTGFAGLFLLCFTQKQKTGKLLISFCLIFIAIISYKPFANLLLSPLEKTYTKYEPAQSKISYVAVLGGGHTTDFTLPLSSQIESASLTRLVEGIIIYRENPGSRLIVSGWQGRYDPVPNSAVMASLANAIGVPLDDIIIEPRPKDTKDEARLIKDIVKKDLFVLVTSASHMKRSAALFNHYNLNFIPAPTYFQAKKIKTLFCMPGSKGLKYSEMALHEYLGLIWSKLRGQI
ncbi:DUF218 [Desulfonema limicola]|uniref:DUF218 n=1 Tax=Desulfonema limicola TaxID=45656 RepID=A0A975BB36_9BACT|nr:envelope biogenesis factor ElyC [Desulfonema limicola]QTA82000.1 DUF218 [Desulfonema limicola]